MSAETFYELGIVLILAGMLIIVFAFTLLFFASIREKGKIRGGGAIIIGPFPIIFGTDKESLKTILVLSLALTILLVVVTILFYFMST